jgi:hypothetical protein
MKISFEEYFNSDEEYQPTIECHRHETPEGWVFNIHMEPGAPPPPPEVIAELKQIAERLAAGSEEGKEGTGQRAGNFWLSE